MDMILEQNKMLLKECENMLKENANLKGTKVYENIYALANDLAQDIEERSYGR